MKDPFITPDSTLSNNNGFSLPDSNDASDGFMIDKKYTRSLSKTVPENRLRIFFLTAFAIIILLSCRIFYLQIFKGSEFYAIAEGNRIKTEIVTAPRGIFYDRAGKKLADNLPKFNLLFDKQIWQEKKDASDFINKTILLTGLTEDEIIAQAEKQSQELETDFIALTINYSTAMIVKSNNLNYPEFKVQLSSQRKYYDPNLSHILGYLGKINPEEWTDLKKQNYILTDLVGKDGLEKEYENTLRGQHGKIEYEVNAQGQIIKILNSLPTMAGKDLYLSLDSELTIKITQVLNDQLRKIGCRKAVAVAQDPRTGEILALVSLPSFDNNIFNDPQKYSVQLNSILQDEDQPLFNRGISGKYPSGSTIKPMLATAALEEKIISRWTSILSVGGIKINVWYYPDWKVGGHGPTTVIKALAESVNTFFYYIGGGYQDFKGLGLEKIISYAKLFGFGKKLGIDLPNEANGFLPSREWKKEIKNEDWYIGDTYHLSIGQGDLLVTPLQINNLTSILANSGIFYKPQLVKGKSKIVRQDFISQENISIVRQGLRNAVTNGSALALNDLPFTSAGKTGTAQVGGDKNPHAWFTVFAPYENPEIALTILIENGGDGDKVAVPVAKEILKWYFRD
ncbi:penicillin-binding protein 2 [Candidatus Parcubacteria bacterium]|nr:penicillin-binding protein 2 [Candidatus Parcubacteria bacterium]